MLIKNENTFFKKLKNKKIHYIAIWVDLSNAIANVTVFAEQQKLCDELCNLYKLSHDKLKIIISFFKEEK